MKMLKLMKALKEMMMEKIKTDKKHIKKLKPQAAQPSTFGAGNGGNPCPPVGGDLLATNN
jgi:hypothetical protein